MERLRAEAITGLDIEEALSRVERTIESAIETDEPLLAKMVADLVRAGGKRMRPRITLLSFAACGGKDPAQAIIAAAAGELIHTASLVHDDIIDQSPLRRGRPTMHVAYGMPHALVAGDFLFTKGFALSGTLPKELVDVTARACVALAEGEVMEQRLLADEVDEESYLKIIGLKTAEPIRAAGKIGAMLAGAPKDIVEEMGHFGYELGIAFQIADDVLDIAGDPGETGKTVGQDAKTGVLTMPVGLGEDARTFRQLARDLDPHELRAKLESVGAIERARDAARKFARTAEERLARLPDSPYKAELVQLAREMSNRRK